jgi:two-component system NtrC family response regulator
MNLALTRALQYRREKQAQRPLTAIKREGIVGSSPRLNHCLDLLAQAAASEAPVLLTGETGTGKEVFARAIHENSARGAGGEFVVVDCAALPENLVESTLFGHDRGAFTGADRARIGLVKLADGGSLFLDEVGELPLSIQKNFLRVLQESRFRPVGQGPEVESHFRLITATHRDLETMAQEGTFRQDLLFRIRSHVIELSPLRENMEDLKELTLHYIAKLCERYQIPTKGVSPDFLEALAQYDWPGNVRELIYTLERALAAAQGAPTLYATHLPLSLRIRAAQTLADENLEEDIARKNPLPAPPDALPQLQQARQAAIQVFEEQYLRDLLDLSQGNVKRAAQMAGVSRQHLYDLLKRHHIRHPEN